jgi:hypothetical protein
VRERVEQAQVQAVARFRLHNLHYNSEAGGWKKNMDQSTSDKTRDTAPSPAKKPYTTPSFRYESVFETSALSCGKMQGTQGACNLNRKVS